MAVAGSLEVQIFANLARLQSDMTKTKGIVGGAMKSVEGAVASARRAFGLLGVGLGAGLFVRMIKGTVDAQDELSKLSQKVGVSVEELAGLKHAADLSGISFEGLQKGIKTVSTQMFDAASGLKESQRNFAALGIEIKQTDGSLKGAEAVLVEVADKFAKMRDGTEKTALAVKLFGKAGLEMIPLLNQGSAALAQMTQEGKRLNPVTAESAKQAEIFNDNMTRLSGTLKSGLIKSINAALPALSEISNAMAEAARQSGFLMAIWVGMGGVFANIAGITDIQKQTQRLQELNKEISSTQKQLASGTLNPKGTGESFFNFLVPNVPLNAEAKNTLSVRIKALIEERDKILQSLQPRTPARPPVGFPTIIDTTAGATGKALKESVGSFEDWAMRMQAAVAGAITDNDITKAADLAKQIEILDSLFFDAGLSPALYEAALKKLTGATENLSFQQKVQAEQQRKQNELMEEGKRVFEATRTPVEELVTEFEKMNRLVNAGAIDWDTYQRAIKQAQDRFEELSKTAKTELDEMGEFAKEAARGIQRGFSDTLFDFMQGKFDNMGDRFKQLIDRMVADALAAKLGAAMFGDFDKSGNIGGWIGNLLGLGSVDVGSIPLTPIDTFATGTDFVPRTGLYQLHKGESVTPAAENNSSRRPLNFTLVQNFPNGISNASANQAAAAAGRAVSRAMSRNG